MKKLWNHYSYVICLIIISVVATVFLSFQFGAFQQKTYMKVKVAAGDSLWKIADEYSDNQTMSNQNFVNWVLLHNDIDADHIFPGQVITIPVKTDSAVDQYASAPQN